LSTCPPSPLNHSLNCRDLHWVAQDLLPPGRIWRSGALDRLDAKDLETLQSLEIHTVIDLRAPTEMELFPDQIPANTVLHKIPLLSDQELAQRDLLATGPGQMFQVWAERLEANPQAMAENLRDLYLDLIGPLRPQLALATQHFLQGLSRGNVLFHCTAGKDRTGVLAALLLHHLGLPHSEILKDYLQTNALFSGPQGPWRQALAAYPSELVQAMLLAPQQAMEAVLKALPPSSEMDHWWAEAGITNMKSELLGALQSL
jgi:protein-tyrosine phosphatase